MRTALVTFNASYIHRCLALRWLYVCRPAGEQAQVFEFVVKDDLDDCARRIIDYHPAVVAMAVYIWNGLLVAPLARRLRALDPDVRIVLGGPEAGFRWPDYLGPDVQAVIRGEGEQTFWPYVLTGEHVAGLASHGYVSPTAYPLTDLSWLQRRPDPYFLDFDAADMDRHYMYIETSRGCPAHCTYCLASQDNSCRTFSLDYLQGIFDRLARHRVKQVKFLDRTFNMEPDRSLAIAGMLSRLPTDMSFQFEVLADSLEPRLMDMLAADANPGRWRLEVGIQSFDPAALAAVGRRQDLQRLCANVRRLTAAGVVIHGDLIAGLPRQDAASFAETYQQALALGMDELQLGILKLLPGTPLDRQRTDWGIVSRPEPPYAIVSSRWMDAEDVRRASLAALATERLYNRGWCRGLISWQAAQDRPMFDIMVSYGRLLEGLPRPYQPWQLFGLLRRQLADGEAAGRLSMDYYRLFRRRPPRYEPLALTRPQMSRLVSAVIAQGTLAEAQRRDVLVAAGWYQDRAAWQLLLYGDGTRHPVRLLTDRQGRLLAREECDEQDHDRHGQ